MMYIFPFISAVLGLFLWMYLVTYALNSGVPNEVLLRARKGVFRGAIVAGIFLLFQSIPSLSQFLYHDWVLFPAIFFIISLPWTWRLLLERSFTPIIIGFVAWFVFSFFHDVSLFWSPFHEEIGKWYQAMVSIYPAIISPFVSLGFSVVENFSYFTTDASIAHIIGRTFFSLPLHIFTSILAIFFYLRFRSSFRGIFLGLASAIMIHFFYNWSLSASIIITLFIMIAGYMFYGWSLENGWWKNKILNQKVKETD